MRGGVTRQPFEALGDFHHVNVARITVDLGAELRGLLQRFVERDVELVGNKFGDAIHFPVRQVHGASHVLDRGLGGHGSKRNDLRDIRTPVFRGDVLDDVATTPLAEIDVDIRHRDAFGIEKAFEQQIVLERIDVRDLERVAYQAAGGRSSAGSNGNSLRSRVTNEIPDDQEVACVAHLLNHANFVGQARFIFGQSFSQQALLGARFEDWHAGRKTFPHDRLEMAIDRTALGNLKFGKRILHGIDFDVAAPGNRHGALQRVRNFAEDLRHFLRRLEEELVGGKFHAMRIAHRLAGLNAEQDFLSVRIGVCQIVAIVRGDEGNSGFTREADDFRIDALFDFQSLILDFQKKVSLAENIAEAVSGFAGLVGTLFHQIFGDRAFQTRGQRD